MGQYYIIVNLERREFISPQTFGDGPKLLEFGCSSDGLMLGLALLTASGNGRGMGDLSRQTCETQPTTFEPKTWERIESEWLSDCDHLHNRLPKSHNVRHRIIVPSVIGSWAGDPIITAGDYMDQAKYMTPEEYVDGLEREFRRDFKYQNEMLAECNPPHAQMSQEEYLETEPTLQYNLYDHASRKFIDAGPHLKFAMTEYGQGRVTARNFDEILHGQLGRMLEGAYDPKIKTGTGRRARWRWRIDWMTPELLDSFLRQWHDPVDFKRAKTWLQHQLPALWQREFIKAYRVVNGKVEFFDDKARKALREHAGIEWLSTSLFRIEMPPILPERALLEAAIAVQLRTQNKENPYLVSTNMDGYAEQVADAAAIPLRHRVIDLDGPKSKER